MIAREKSFDRNFQLTDRVDSLNDEQRKTILRWEFDLLDKDKNLYVDQDELLRIRETLGPMEPCIYGFLQELQLDRNWSRLLNIYNQEILSKITEAVYLKKNVFKKDILNL